MISNSKTKSDPTCSDLFQVKRWMKMSFVMFVEKIERIYVILTGKDI